MLSNKKYRMIQVELTDLFDRIKGDAAELVQRAVGAKGEYDLMFYGFGRIAREAVSTILRADRDILSPVRRIYIAGGRGNPTPEVAAEIERYKRENFVVNPGIDIVPIKKGEVSEHLKHTDMFFLTAGADPSDTGDRLEMTACNIGIVDSVAELFSGDYSGMVHVLTNQPELLSYRLAQMSEINPFRITGNGQLDRRRANGEVIKMILKANGLEVSDSDIFCVGYHGAGAWPVVNKMGIKLANREWREYPDISAEMQAELSDIIRSYGPRQKRLQIMADGSGTPTVESTGSAILDVVLASIYGTTANVSCFYKRQGSEGRYVLMPALFREGICIPDENLLQRLTASDQRELDKAVGELYDLRNLASAAKRHKKVISWSDKPVLPPSPEPATVASPVKQERDAKIEWAEEILKTWVEKGTVRFTPALYLANGGFSRIYRGRDALSGRDVAIKISEHPGEVCVREVFERERDFLANHKHPHLIGCYDYRECNGHSVLVMELADHSLQEVITLPGRLELERVKSIMEQVCSGVGFIHSHKDGVEALTHRDLKPSNVLSIDRNTIIIKVSDLGCVGLSGLTTTMHGTSAYRALEGFDLGFVVESDIYSLGIMTYAFFAKGTPYQGLRREKELLRCKRSKTFVEEKCREIGLSQDLTTVIAKAAMPDPSDRFHSAAEFMDALRSVESAVIDRASQERRVSAELERLYGTLRDLLPRGYGEYGLSKFADIEEIYTAHNHFQRHAESHNLTGGRVYREGEEAYQRRVEHDKDIFERCVNKCNDRNGWINPALDLHLFALIHLWGIADERISLRQCKDGTLKKHYEEMLEERKRRDSKSRR